MKEIVLENPMPLILGLVALGLAPFLAVMVTSFSKLAIALSLVRNALGVQQVPPNMVINGLAIIMSMYIMAPVAEDTLALLREEDFSLSNIRAGAEALGGAAAPLKGFLIKNSHDTERAFFLSAARRIWPAHKAEALQPDDLMVVVPAFTVSQITSGFKVGFLIYLPFLAVDMLVSNILLAMGMNMLSPTTISLPCKLLLLVMIDGWARLIHSLTLGYA
jgi:type III secretion protein R